MIECVVIFRFYTESRDVLLMMLFATLTRHPENDHDPRRYFDDRHLDALFDLYNADAGALEAEGITLILLEVFQYVSTPEAQQDRALQSTRQYLVPIKTRPVHRDQSTITRWLSFSFRTDPGGRWTAGEKLR